jgi:AbrB family looped-hinge helix DNA binding protein
MKLTIQIGRAGRVTLPKQLRARFRLKRGHSPILEVKGDVIQLLPKKPKVWLEKVSGVLVLASERPLEEGRDLVSGFRDERIDKLARRARKP